MPSSTEVTCSNVMDLPLDTVRELMFGAIERHDRSVVLDPELYVRLLGEYAAMYQYTSEIFVYLAAVVRSSTEARNVMRKIKAMDRRECLDQVLKVIKFEYDSLSRKVTVMQSEGD